MKNPFDVEYVEAFEPSIAELATYVRLAKGPNRTMAQFAEACGVSASTLSRLANEKITRRISVDLIQAIMKNAANQDMFDYDMFMRANGMMPKEDFERRKQRDVQDLNLHEQKRTCVNVVKNALWRYLSEQGYATMYLDRLDFKDWSVSQLGYGSAHNAIPWKKYDDFVMRIQGAEPTWYIIDTKGISPYDKSELSDESRLIHQELMDWSTFFLMDAWEPECFKNLRISFVFINEDVFNKFVQTVKSQKINARMSAVLVDVAGQSVVEEISLN